MIVSSYEVRCDWCCKAINHYIYNKPTKKILEGDGCILLKDKIFCSLQCCNYYRRMERERKNYDKRTEGKEYDQRLFKKRIDKEKPNTRIVNKSNGVERQLLK